MRSLIFLLLIHVPALAVAENIWHWDSKFSSYEKHGLMAWVNDNEQALATLVGPLGLDMHVHFERSYFGHEPVPWARTNKGEGRRVYFQVDTSYAWAQFEKDWTAPHELVHLLFPYLGEDSRWFAEGIASYLQYQVMYASGVLDWPQAIDRYRGRFKKAASGWRHRRTSVVELSRTVDRNGAFVRLYWGGAAYFLAVDQRLAKEKGLRLNQVIRRYMNCCYQPWGMDADGMMKKMNELSGSQVFTEVYAETVSRPGFPETAAALEWLARHPPPMLGNQ